MISIEFHYRPSRRREGGEGKVVLRVIRRRKSVSLTLPYSLRPGEWDPVLHQPVIPPAQTVPAKRM